MILLFIRICKIKNNQASVIHIYIISAHLTKAVKPDLSNDSGEM